MRSLLVVLALAACDDHGKSPSIPCFDMECSGDELCIVQDSGIDAGVGWPPQCIAIPQGCLASDCNGSGCPRCILDLCASSALLVHLHMHTLRCPAQ